MGNCKESKRKPGIGEGFRRRSVKELVHDRVESLLWILFHRITIFKARSPSLSAIATPLLFSRQIIRCLGGFLFCRRFVLGLDRAKQQCL